MTEFDSDPRWPAFNKALLGSRHQNCSTLGPYILSNTAVASERHIIAYQQLCCAIANPMP